MDKTFVKGLLVAAASALTFAQPAEAAMSCWNSQAASAVAIKDLQSRLMVGTLMCNAMGYDSSASYNRFVLANRTALNQANRDVKARFTVAYGKRSLKEYDRFNTSLANAYGAKPTDRSVCEANQRAARDAAAAKNNSAKLLAIAEDLGTDVRLPGGRCGRDFASR
jgi:hypothetical protein